MKKLTCQRLLSLTLAVVLVLAPTVVYAQNSLVSDILTVSTKTLPQNIQNLLAEGTESIIPDDNLYSLTVPVSKKTYQTEVFSVPVKYIDRNGQTKYIDTSMKASDKAGFDYEMADNIFSVAYSKESSRGLQVDDAFTVSALSTSRISTQATVSKTEDGDGRLIYPNVFGEHTFIEYVNTNSGYKENIVLERNISKNRFDFVFKSETHTPVLATDGKTIQIVDINNPEKFDYLWCPIYVHDSYVITDDSTEEELAYRHFTEDGYYEVTQNGANQYIITYVVPESFLNDARTVYPVIIDPTVTVSRAQSNIHDTFVTQSSPNANYGSYDYLRFGYNGGKIFSYVRFVNLGIPLGATINSASLTITFRSGQTTSYNGGCLLVTNRQWNESDITWDTQPYGTNGYTSTDHECQYYEFEMTEFVRGWHNGSIPNYGVDFTYTNETHNDYNSAYSSEGNSSKAPKLEITYTIAGETEEDEYAAMNWSYFFRGTNAPKRISQTWSPTHIGIDVPAAAGTNIYSTTGGTVIARGESTSMGYYVIIRSSQSDHTGEKLITRNMHMLEYPPVNLNQSVTKNTIIGKVGNTGDSYGNHLHFDVNNMDSTSGSELRENYNRTIDPERFFPNIAFTYSSSASASSLLLSRTEFITDTQHDDSAFYAIDGNLIEFVGVDCFENYRATYDKEITILHFIDYFSINKETFKSIMGDSLMYDVEALYGGDAELAKQAHQNRSLY